MRRPFPFHRAPTGTSSGFILVAVLLLVALVTVLVTTMSFLARIERNATSNAASAELARQNALFGLNVALAQLQKTAGPDQSITARADILDSNPATLQVDSVKQPYWTGVWPTGKQFLDANPLNVSDTSEPQRQISFNTTTPGATPSLAQKSASAKWLVSDPVDPSTGKPLVLDPLDASGKLSSFPSVALAKNLPDPSQSSPTTSPAISVKAPLVSIYTSAAAAAANPAQNPSGKYAFWVSDEGVKAKVNLPDPTFAAPTTGTNANSNPNFVENQLHFLAPQANAVQSGLLGTANTIDIRSSSYASDLTKVTSLQSLGLVGLSSTPPVTGMSGSAAAQFSPDATTYSYGVLADVRNGGLKTDLSQAFESPTQFSSFLATIHTTQTSEVVGDEKVWKVIQPSFDQNNSQTTAEFGTRWQGLYNYYSMYKKTIPAAGEAGAAACPWSNIDAYSTGNPGTTTPTVDGRVFDYISNPTGSTTAQQTIGEYYSPHIMGYGVYFSMSSVKYPLTPAVSGVNNYSLIMYAEPRIVFYNPYNVTLSSANVGAYLGNLSSNLIGRSWSISVGSAAGAGQVVQNNQVIGWGGTNNGGGGMNLLVNTSANFTLKPGELRVYGLQTSTQANTTNNPADLLLYDGSSKHAPALSDTVGQSTWQYVASHDSSRPGRARQRHAVGGYLQRYRPRLRPDQRGTRVYQ